MQNLSDQDRLRLTLRASLCEVLGDKSMDGPLSMMPDRILLQAQRNAGLATSCPSWNSDLLAHSLAAQHINRSKFDSTSSALKNFVAATLSRPETSLLDHIRTALVQRKIDEEQKRLMEHKDRLLNESYIAYLQHQWASKLSRSQDLTTLGAGSVGPAQDGASPVADQKTKATETLRALGSQLRNRADPYIDVSSFEEPAMTAVSLPKARGGVILPFPIKLHQMLAEAEKEGNTDVVSFYSHGRAFAIHDMRRFVDEIMPKYFKQSKWNSFARQLNLYGFTRMQQGQESIRAYYHELFLRGRPNLVTYMRRVGVPQGEDRRKFKPKSNIPDPDFETFPSCYARSTKIE